MKAAALAVAALACASTAAAGTVMDTISGDANLSVLNSLITAAGLQGALGGAGPLTVLAPSNDAFSKLETYRVAYLKANPADLASVLKYHVSASAVAFTLHEHIPTLQGQDVFVEYITNTTTLGLDSTTCDKDVRMSNTATASNGKVVTIDTVLMPSGIFCPDSLFFAEQRHESRIGYVGYDCRSKGTTVLSNNEDKPVGLAVDSKTQEVYWSNDQNAKPFDSWLSHSGFDGSGRGVFLNDLYDPQGMVVDEGAGKLYFTEHQGSKVHRCNLDGTNIETIKSLNPSDEFPADVAVDPEAQLVFMTIQSQPQVLQGKLAVMAYNGSNYKVLETGLIQNYGLCVDTYAKHVYYIQGGHGGGINCLAYGGKPCGGTDGVIATGLEYPYMCTVDNLWAPYGGPTTIIFSEANVPGSVFAMDQNGKNMRLINTDLDAPMGVKLGCTKPASA